MKTIIHLSMVLFLVFTIAGEASDNYQILKDNPVTDISNNGGPNIINQSILNVGSSVFINDNESPAAIHKSTRPSVAPNPNNQNEKSIIIYSPDYTFDQNSSEIDKSPTTILDAPPNDNCASVTPETLNIGSPLTFTGDNTEATSDCYIYMGNPEVWVAFTTTQPLSISIDYCGTSPTFNSVGALLTTCPCGGMTFYDSSSWESCGDGNATLYFNSVGAGTYYYGITKTPSSTGQYTIHITASLPPPPPANDNCLDIEPDALAAGDTLTYSGNSSNATSDCDLIGAPEVWEAFTITEELNVTIDFCGTNPSPGSVLDVLTQCSCESLITAYNIDWDFCGDGNPTIKFTHLPAGTYYYPIFAEGSSAGSYALNITASVPPAGPTNDNCSAAAAIGNVQSLAFSTLDATVDGPGMFINSPNLWYLYTAPYTGSVLVSTYPSNFDTRVAVYDGSACPASENPTSHFYLTGGEDIASASAIPFTLPVAIQGTTSGYDHDYELPAACSKPNSSPDVVYSYTANFTGSLNLFLSSDNLGEYGMVLVVMDGSGNPLAFNGDYNDWMGTKILNFPVTMGQTYYLLISDAFGMPHDSYMLTLSAPSYTMLACSNDYYFMSYNYFTIDATEGHQYLIEIGGRDSETTGEGLLTIGPLPIPPANDNCENATYGGILYPDSAMQFTGDATGATVDCDSLRFEAPQAWLSFTIEDTMDIRIDYCDQVGDGVMGGSSVLVNSCPCGHLLSGIYDARACENHPLYGLTFNWISMPPGTYRYPIVYIPGIVTPYVINVKGKRTASPQVCSDDALFGQSPSISSDPWGFFISQTQSEWVVADNFTNVPDTISQITWWGLTASNYPDFVPCNTSPMDFEITFCISDGGIPGLPGDTVRTYSVSVIPEETGASFNTLPQKKFTASINPPIRINNGWVIINGTGTDSCWFLWQDAHAGTCARFIDNTLQWATINYNLALCLNKVVLPPPECSYMPGDINGDGQRIGGDVTYGVRYFKGTGPAPLDSCYMDSTEAYLYVSGDVNGNCEFRGSDITRLVAYFKGTAQLSYCHFFPPPVLRNNKAISPKLSGEN